MINPKLLIGFSEEDYPNVLNFSSIGDCTFKKYDRNYLVSNIGKFDIFIPHLFEKIDKELIDLSVSLKILATPSTGSDHIDVDYLSKKNIKFISLNQDREFINNISSTAEMTWLLILACARNFRSLINRVQSERSWLNTDIRGYELNNKKLGIIGYGRLGKMVAKYGKSFGMEVLAYDIDPKKYDNLVTQVEFSKLLKESDVISLHAKLNKTSFNLISYEEVNLMKKGVIIVNTARGGIINSKAILDGIDEEKIGAIGLDVCNHEYQSSQLPKDPLVNRSFSDNRIIITPHAGGSTIDAHAKVFGKTAEFIKSYLEE
tara:strand:- start:668 stop:1618 length:951 start_codon:yes stop_codon:yes gene_type:complete